MCRQVWLHSVCPSETIRRTTLGLLAALAPSRQKVALTPHCRSRSRIFGVLTGSGPSSKVSATASEPVTVMVPSGPVPVARERSMLAVPEQSIGAGLGGAVVGLGGSVGDGEGDS